MTTPQRPKRCSRPRGGPDGQWELPSGAHRRTVGIARCCLSGKVRFRGQDEAKDALTSAVYARAVAGATSRRREVRCYPCQACGGWHLTSQPLHATAASSDGSETERVELAPTGS